MDKEELRKKYGEIRARMHARLRYEDKQKIYSNLRALNCFSKAKTILCYFARGSEVPTKNIILELLNSDKKVALPRTDTQVNTITPHLITSLDDLEPSCFGLLEPKAGCELCNLSQIDVVLVPAVVFDLRGHRLGYGLGFYDRFLPKLKCETIGLAYDDAVSTQNLPNQSYDVPVAHIVTERRIISCQKK